MSEKPVLEWVDDSSEDWYELAVFDAFGDEVYAAPEIPGVSGSQTVTIRTKDHSSQGCTLNFA